ncbi:MAG: FHA domain-containing protein [Chloroflexota bacterium]
MRLDSATREAFTLGNRAVIGRLDTCDLPVDDKSVSREHARLSRLRDGYVVEDLGSTNGTLVNGRRISEAVLLRAGDVLTIGSVDFRFEQEAPPPVEILAGAMLSTSEPSRGHTSEGHAEPQLLDGTSVHADVPVVVDSASRRTPDTDIPFDDGSSIDTAPRQEADTAAQPNVRPTSTAPEDQQAQPGSNAAETRAEEAVALVETLRDVMRDLFQRLENTERERSNFEEVRREAEDGRNLRRNILQALESGLASSGSSDETSPLNDLLDSLIANPRDVEVLLNVAQRATAIREALDDAARQRGVLERVLELARGSESAHATPVS